MEKLEFKKIEAKAIDKAKAKDTKAIAIESVKTLKVEDKAVMIMDTVKADIKWLRFYCKVVHNLPESTLQFILEGSRKANSPDRYFAHAAAVELGKLGL